MIDCGYAVRVCVNGIVAEVIVAVSKVDNTLGFTLRPAPT